MKQSNNIGGNSKESVNSDVGEKIVAMAICFLRMFLCETLAKRLMSAVLIAIGVPNQRVTELTHLCDRSVRSLKKAIDSGNTDNLFVVKGGGRKSKLGDIEQEVIDEINTNNYHTRQQIADMIEEEYGIKLSVSAVGRL